MEKSGIDQIQSLSVPVPEQLLSVQACAPEGRP